MQIARRHNPVELREAQSEDEAKRIWLGRKSAFGAMGQINDYMCLDGTIPVSALPEVLRRIGEMSKDYGLDVANVFHAGDGNMHPLILFDANKPGDLELCEAFGADILKLCVEVGGCLTGEHGVGIEKRDLMTAQFEPQDLEIQMKVKDVFDPAWLLNPAKVFPAGGVRSATEGPSRRLTAATRRGGRPPRAPPCVFCQDEGAGAVLTPTTETDLSEAIAAASGPLRIMGGGTRPVGRPVAGEALSVAGLTGVELYEPGALTIVARRLGHRSTRSRPFWPRKTSACPSSRWITARFSGPKACRPSAGSSRPMSRAPAHSGGRLP
jgi:FAD/FMN-containing dehydrogenase